MFVRTAGERDLPAIRALLAETWHDTYDVIHGAEKVTAITGDRHSIAVLRARLDKPRTEFIVADDGTQIGGMAFASASGKTLDLHELYVRPSLQGRGIGGLLLDEIETAFPEATKVRLEVEQANTRAVAFYLSHGFAEVGHTPDSGAFGSGVPGLIFERPIAWAD